jgi:hypothetical protein
VPSVRSLSTEKTSAEAPSLRFVERVRIGCNFADDPDIAKNKIFALAHGLGNSMQLLSSQSKQVL